MTTFGHFHYRISYNPTPTGQISLKIAHSRTKNGSGRGGFLFSKLFFSPLLTSVVDGYKWSIEENFGPLPVYGFIVDTEIHTPSHFVLVRLF